MSFFRKLLLGTGLVLVVLALIGFFLPRQVHVERSVTINASRSTVFTIVNGFKHFNQWSPWVALDPAAKYTYEGPAEGKGAKMAWVGDPATLGSGSQEVTLSEPWSKVQANINFGPQGNAVVSYTVTPEGAGTKIVWGLDTDMGANPVGRYFGLMFDKMIGSDFERGLAGLKDFAERLPKGDFTDLVVDATSASAPNGGYSGKVVTVTHEGPVEQVSDTVQRLSAYLAAHGIEKNGNSWTETVQEFSPAAVAAPPVAGSAPGDAAAAIPPPPPPVKTIIYVPVK